jgi:3-deoxy-7-phosphoheptulonate synthase
MRCMADPPPRPTVPAPPPGPDEVADGGREPPAHASTEHRPYLVFLKNAGNVARPPFLIDVPEIEIGRRPESTIRFDDESISRTHAYLRQSDYGTILVEDAGSANGTLVNGVRIREPMVLRDGDRLQIGIAVLKFMMQDELDEKHHRALYAAAGVSFTTSEAPTSTRRPRPWTPEGWRSKPVAQEVQYADTDSLARVTKKLARLPPLVTSWEVEELRSLIADAQDGGRFLVQGGDCAETLDECEPQRIAAKLKILIQMSIVLIRATRRPVIRIGRFAGQYAKPRSSPVEKRDGVELPSYFGDLVNRPEFTAAARKPDPDLLLAGYMHAALTINFVRALSSGGFADLRRPEYFDLSYFERAELPTDLSFDYQRICREITEGLNFVRAFGDRSADDLMKVSFFTSHEGLNLLYEEAQTRTVPRRQGYYDLTTHLPWIGERTRALDGAHIEFFRGIRNPIAVKIGPKTPPHEAVDLCRALNPLNEPGRLVLITRIGAQQVMEKLEPIVTAVARARRQVLWVSDPMHGNSVVTRNGTKTRNFDEILLELENTIDVHTKVGTYFGGVHFELTGEDVTECVGGGLTEEDLSRNYETLCDPRLNYRQALQLAFKLGRRLSETHRDQLRSSRPPPSSI